MIAFSIYSNVQVFLKVFTLEQMAKNKIDALLTRKEIRDSFDLEFILKKGGKLPEGMELKKLDNMKKIIKSFGINDYKFSLGSLLDIEQRKHYVENNFKYLITRLNE
jgi:hypothetical protein